MSCHTRQIIKRGKKQRKRIFSPLPLIYYTNIPNKIMFAFFALPNSRVGETKPAHPLAVIQLENVQIPISQLVSLRQIVFMLGKWPELLRCEWSERTATGSDAGATQRGLPVVVSAGGISAGSMEKKQRDNCVSWDYTL